MPYRASLIIPLMLSLTLNTSIPRMPTGAAHLPADKPAPARARGVRPDSPDALSSLGRRTQTSPLLPLHDLAAGANVGLVSTANGCLNFAVTDLSLDGPAPLVFQRTYVSDRTRDAGLGRGWAFVFDDYVSVEGDAATLHTASAPALSFRREGRLFRREPAGAGKHQRFELVGADLIAEPDGELTRFYRNVGGAFRLNRIALPDGGDINITRDAAGLITGISSGSGSLTLHWGGDKRARLLRVADHTGRRVSFHQRGGSHPRLRPRSTLRHRRRKRCAKLNGIS